MNQLIGYIQAELNSYKTNRVINIRNKKIGRAHKVVLLVFLLIIGGILWLVSIL